MVLTKTEMVSFFLEDPINGPIERELNNTLMKYFYFESDLKLRTNKKEILNGCLLLGRVILNYNGSTFELNQFDIFFIPPSKEASIEVKSKGKCKICLYYSTIDGKIDADFEIKNFDFSKFVPRGELGSENKMCTFRKVFTAIKNRYFMSGYTNIPNESLRQGVITSVNLEKNCYGNVEIYPHIHPEYPEIYIMCIDDEKYAISQYIISTGGQSVCKDLTDGDGLFFHGNLGHCNFARPFYKNLKFCMYYWCIPTFGKVKLVKPITIQV